VLSLVSERNRKNNRTALSVDGSSSVKSEANKPRAKESTKTHGVRARNQGPREEDNKSA
jgi:hypothetical protein